MSYLIEHGPVAKPPGIEYQHVTGHRATAFHVTGDGKRRTLGTHTAWRWRPSRARGEVLDKARRDVTADKTSRAASIQATIRDLTSQRPSE